MKSKLLCPLTRSNLMHLHIVAKITYCLSSHGEVEMEWSLEMWFHSTFLNVEHVRRLLLVLLLLLLLFGIWVKALAINLFQISDKCLIFGAEMNGFPYCSNSLSLSLSLSLSKLRQTLDTQSLYLEPFVWLILMCLHFMCGL